VAETLISLFRGVGEPFELRAVTAPTVDAGHTLVQVTLATICGSDLHTVSGRRDAPTPCVLGHEGVGQIVESVGGNDATGQPLRPGDRVTWSLMATCGECAYCGPRGLPQKCDELSKYGHARYEDARDLNGCFAGHILLKPGTRIYRLPDEVTDEEAVPLNCAGATIVGGLQAVGARAGESAVVLGAGMLGLYAVARLSDLGYATVAIVDRLASRLRQAAAFGATHTFQVGEDGGDIGNALTELTNGRGPDLAVEVSGSPAALTSAVDWLGVGGRCLTLGYVYPGSDVAFDAHKLVTKCLTLQGLHNYRPEALGDALAFVSATRTRFHFHALVAPTYPLSDLDAAFAHAAGGDAIRVGVTPV
jgi:putative phosphonate catabolism associated alcohol dehydrogenase